MKNYFKLAIRNLLRNKEYFLINVFGLAVGMACAIVVMLSIWEQVEYDNFHPRSHQLYRAYIDVKLGGLESKAAVTSPLLAFGLKPLVPEIEQSCRIYRMNSDLAITKPLSYTLESRSYLFVDSTFFDLFGFKLLKGDPKTCLNQKNSIILTVSLAKKLFPDGDAFGKKIKVEQNKEWQVTGIVEDNRKNSHLSFQALVSFHSAVFPASFVWTTNFLYTYFRFKPDSPLNKSIDAGYMELSPMEYKLTESFLAKAGEELKKTIGMSLEDLHQEDSYYLIRLQKIEDIHLFSNLKYELSQNVNFQTFLILAAIAILIILIGCINYANLSTARLAGRVREIGIRKILGSQKRELSAQLLSESITISFISLLFALVLVELFYPQINLMKSSYDNIPLQLLKLSPIIFAITLFTGILAGVYPAFYIIRFNPATILRQQKQFSAGGKNLRGILLIIQFIFSIIIIFSTSTIYRQLRYIQHRGIGFDRENMIVLENVRELKEKREAFRDSLMKIPGVQEVTFSSSVPGRNLQLNSYKSGKDRQKNHLMYLIAADSLFLRTYGIKMEEGKDDFVKNSTGDTLDIYINQEGVKYLDLVNPVDKYFYEIKDGDSMLNLKIKGVVQDFNMESLHSKIQPLVIIPLGRNQAAYGSIRLNQPASKELIRQIQKTWDEFLPNIPFSEFSLEESLGAFYQEEQKTGQIALIFSFLAIFIASMGLYSLLALTTVYRTKEIGIRKVLGAGIRELTLLLTKEIFKLIVISGLIALPVAILLSNYWLKRFAYHVEVSLTNYCLVFLAVLVVAIFTIHRQLRKTINADPAVSLRYE